MLLRAAAHRHPRAELGALPRSQRLTCEGQHQLRIAVQEAPLEPSETTQAFMTQAVLSLSESYFYPAPVLLELKDFTHKQASVFQVARAPGKTRKSL